MRVAAFLVRLCAGVMFGAQLFFSAVSAPAAFDAAVVATPPGSAERQAAGDLVGRQLANLDRITVVLAAIAVLAAVFLARRGVARARQAALPLLVAGVLAFVSLVWLTPYVHELRALRDVSSTGFELAHRASTALLVGEMVLALAALWLCPSAPEG